jgi:hypothetical protein
LASLLLRKSRVLRKSRDIVKTFAGIADFCAGLRLERKDVVGLVAPGGEAGFVSEADARGEELGAQIVFEVGIDPVGGDGFIEGKFPFGGEAGR